MRTLLLVLSALLAVSMTLGDQKRFDNYKLLRIQPQTDEHLRYLLDLGSNEDVDIWNDARGIKTLVDIVLSPEAFEKYSQQFVSINLPFVIVQQNLQNIIDEETRSMKRDGRSIVGKFADYANIISYMNEKAEENESFVSVKNIGSTYEKRQLKTLRIKVKNPKERIWIDCGIHAREWISPATCIWMIEKFINDYNNNDPEVVKILEEFEIHFMPLVNPDGYEYTKTSYRLWRKNRAPNKGSTCIGTDLNRNYGFKWMTGGSSNNPCSDTFAGSAADSELETQAMEKEILFEKKWHSYLTIHTYGLWWFLPWGYSTVTIPDYDELEDKAKIACAAIKKVNGLDFEIGSSAQLLYVNSGPSDDWARGNASIKYSYTLELRPGQSGPDSNYGFTLPENRVPLAGDETYQGVKAYLKAFLKN